MIILIVIFFNKLEENSPRPPYAAEDRINKVKTSARSEFRVIPYLRPLKSTSTGTTTPQAKGHSSHPREAWSSFFPHCFLHCGLCSIGKKLGKKNKSTNKTLQTKIRKGDGRMLTALHDTNIRASFLVQSIARTSSCTSHYIWVSVRNHWQDYRSESYAVTHQKPFWDFSESGNCLVSHSTTTQRRPQSVPLLSVLLRIAWGTRSTGKG